MLIDTHAHLNFRAYRKDRAEVISRCLNEDMRVINVGSQYQTSLAAIELAEQYPKYFSAAIGFHPIHIADKEFSEKLFTELAEKYPGQIVAIGEVGLDYYHLSGESAENIEKQKNQQKSLLRFFIDLAENKKLPLIFHCRDAYNDLLAELKKKKLSTSGVVHCYLGDQKSADEFIGLGLYLGFTGIITFTDDQKLLDLIKGLPIDKMLIETDAPYLAPVPFRRQRNEPIYVRYVAEKIASLKGMTYQAVVKATAENAERLFGLKDRSIK